MSISIRPEANEDIEQVTDVIDRAFFGKPYAAGDESDVVIRLRTLGVLSLGLVIEVDGDFAGHIAFSPVLTSDGTQGWYALGPVAIYPKLQSQGLGGKLIVEGLAQIKQLGAAGCMLTGNPIYYTRFGFEFAPDVCPVNEPAEFFMIKTLSDAPLPVGPMSFHPAFYE